MRLSLCLLVVAVGLSAARAEEKASDYLKEHKLKERLEVRELQGGFAGFTGTYHAIENDGAWSTGPVLPMGKLGEAKDKGKLTPEQLALLAKDLAKYELSTLPAHGQAEVNPKVVAVRFGTRTVELQPKPGKATAEEDKAIRARYEGIVAAVKAVCVKSKEE
jgi:hypothetical protein